MNFVRLRSRAACAFGAIALFLCSRDALGQAYEVFATFDADHGQPTARLVEVSPGVFYGTTYYGGKMGRGSIFSVGLGEPVAFQELHAFSWPDGGNLETGLTLGPGSFLYGTTTTGGRFGGGTVFRIDPAGRLTTLHDFSYLDDGGLANDLILASDGQLYGTTAAGGANGNGLGTVFRIDATGALETLHAFDGQDGARPSAALVQASDGKFYGSTLASGELSDGPATIFRIDVAGQFEHLYTLSSQDGPISAALVQAPDGHLYGGTYDGGSQGYGTVFRVDLAGNFLKLHDVVSGEGSDIRSALLPSSDGNLWGVTYQQGGPAGGTIFKISPTGAWTTVHGFEYADGGGYPGGSLVLGADGWMYGTCEGPGGDPARRGTVFRINVAGDFENVWTLSNLSGESPGPGVTEGADGNFYGTTIWGGLYGKGTLFRLTPQGDLDFPYDFGDVGTLFSFYSSPLTRASDGALYGTVQNGDPNNKGTLFRYPLGGDLTVIHEFDGTDGALPYGQLVEGPDANLYGVTYEGGATGQGTVFRATFAGAVTTVHEFAPADAIFGPTSILPAADGRLYGTAGGSGVNPGSLFSLQPSGDDFTPLFAFGGTNGSLPNSLIQVATGDFFGTTFGWPGSVFTMDSAGTVTTVHAFQGAEGTRPQGALLQAANGDLYGTAFDGSPTTYGTLFRMTPDGAVTTLWTFHGAEGAHPSGPLLEASDGAIYGTAGVVFRWLTSSVTPTLVAIDPRSGAASGEAAVSLRGTHFQPTVDVTVGGAEAVDTLSFDAQTALMMTPALAPGNLYDVVLTNTDSGTATLTKAWFADFTDMGSINPFHDDVESIVRAGITAGCGSGYYCGAAPVTRAQMAVFLLKAKHGSGFTPPACTGIFDDVACPGAFAVDWIEELSLEGITGGCGTATFCPDSPVRRDQMAVFLLKTSLGSDYVPPVASGTIFADVPASAFAADWIENLYALNVTGGCLTSPLRYCPGNTNNRQQMAVFLTKTFGLQ